MSGMISSTIQLSIPHSRCGIITLVASTITLVAGIVTPVASTITLVAGIITMVAGIITLVAGTITLVAGTITLMAGIITLAAVGRLQCSCVDWRWSIRSERPSVGDCPLICGERLPLQLWGGGSWAPTVGMAGPSTVRNCCRIGCGGW